MLVSDKVESRHRPAGSWEDAKVRAREMVRCTDAGISELARIVATIREEGDKQAPYGEAKMKVVANLRVSIGENLVDLESAIRNMSEFASSTAQRAQLQREQGILQDLRQQFKRLSSSVDASFQHARLMGTATGQESESRGGDDDERNLLRERSGIESSIRELDDMYSSAAGTRNKMQQQNSILSKVKGKLLVVGTSHLPSVNDLVKRIHNRQLRDRIILGTVFGICLCFTIWYEFL
ncbi:hypothetical protein FOZ62_005582 [Perkinsus olseni]|uniref:Golgi SNAP receptor complex member 1 n=1 Tax=Perkinsus olseni TaxID=32597 RepID=A0A7J6TQY3_PEROL|nr:hypothetical protein FOZ62_005582 [Perkinsus olseni]